jgi:hypothetical protein
MDSIHKKLNYLKQFEKKRDLEIVECYESFKSELSPLFNSDIQFHVHRIVSSNDLLKAVVPDAFELKLNKFPFDRYGFIDITKLKNSIRFDLKDISEDLISIKSTAPIGESRVTVLWKSFNPVIELSFNDLISIANEILDVDWEIYLFDMFSNWIIELHHDGYISYGEI